MARHGRWWIAGLLVVTGCGARTEFELDPDMDPLWPVAEERVASVPGSTPVGCTAPASGITLLAGDKDLYRFDPDTWTTAYLGHIDCPDPRFNTLLVDRQGVLWIGCEGGVVVSVDPDSLTCTRAELDPAELYTTAWGAGFAVDRTGREHLFVSPSADVGTSEDFESELVNIDLARMRVQARLPIPESWWRLELTGSGDGRLFALVEPFGGGSQRAVELDPTDGSVVRELFSASWPYLGAFDIAYWEGSIYVFRGAPDAEGWPTVEQTAVLRFQLVPFGQLEDLGVLPLPSVIGADGTTCAPL